MNQNLPIRVNKCMPWDKRLPPGVHFWYFFVNIDNFGAYFLLDWKKKMRKREIFEVVLYYLHKSIFFFIRLAVYSIFCFFSVPFRN